MGAIHRMRIPSNKTIMARLLRCLGPPGPSAKCRQALTRSVSVFSFAPNCIVSERGSSPRRYVTSVYFAGTRSGSCSCIARFSCSNEECRRHMSKSLSCSANDILSFGSILYHPADFAFYLSVCHRAIQTWLWWAIWVGAEEYLPKICATMMLDIVADRGAHQQLCAGFLVILFAVFLFQIPDLDFRIGSLGSYSFCSSSCFVPMQTEFCPSKYCTVQYRVLPSTALARHNLFNWTVDCRYRSLTS